MQQELHTLAWLSHADLCYVGPHALDHAYMQFRVWACSVQRASFVLVRADDSVQVHRAVDDAFVLQADGVCAMHVS